MQLKRPSRPFNLYTFPIVMHRRFGTLRCSFAENHLEASTSAVSAHLRLDGLDVLKVAAIRGLARADSCEASRLVEPRRERDSEYWRVHPVD